MIRVRPGVAADFPAIAAVERSAGALFAGTHMDWAVGELTDEADLAEAAQANMLWVAECDGEIAGFLLAEGIDGDLHIWELAVGRDRQRRGIGRKLVEVALAEATERGFAAATLTTDRTLAWNAPWYRGLGFRAFPSAEIPARLAAQLASEPSPHQRCAMIREL